MMRELELLSESAIKDKSYQQTPVGAEVRRYLSVLAFEGSGPNTLDSYEHVLARLSIWFADFTIDRFCEPDGADHLRDFIGRCWPSISTQTRRHHLFVLRAFFKYEVEERGLTFNPAQRIKPPKRIDTLRIARERHEIRQLLDGQETLRDRCAIGLMCRLAFRKNDLRMLQIKDIDLGRGMIWLRHRKGDEPIGLPLAYKDLSEDLYLHIQAERRMPLEYLLYPWNDRLRPMNQATIHRWFKKALDRAGLPDFPMHETRHTAGDEIHRVTGGNIVAAQQLLGHRSLETTRRYLHPTGEDLRAAMRAVADSWAADE
jgi:integrase